MKIAMVFIDMLRPNLLNLYNNKIKVFDIDKQIRDWGGTLYPNCYTPSPDTARSIACFWTGLNPNKNGCDERIKWPHYFLHTSQKHMLDLLHDNHYQMNFFINKNKINTGLLPCGYNEIGYHNKSLDLKLFLDGVSDVENSFTFIDLSDLHWSIDDYGCHYKGIINGYNKVGNALRIISENLDITALDYYFIFSDHGFKTSNEQKRESKYLLLNDARTNIFMYLRKKGDINLVQESKLCSITDVFPTIAEILNTNNIEVDGISLFNNKNSHNHIIAEDHFQFTPQINQNLDIWAVIRKQGKYFRTLNNHYYENKASFSETDKELDALILANSKQFGKQINQNRIINNYLNLKRDKTLYSDGSRRIQINKNIFKRLINKFSIYRKKQLFN